MALRARCVVRSDPARADLRGIASSLLDDIKADSDRYVCDVLLTDEKQRVTYGASKESLQR